MPSCMDCGNIERFSITHQSVNKQLDANLIASFDSEGFIASMESQGFGLDEAQEAWEFPERSFSYCFQCGSDKIQW